jgi:hypothetical protein
MLPYLVIFSDPHLLSLMSLRKRKEESSVKTVE